MSSRRGPAIRVLLVSTVLWAALGTGPALSSAPGAIRVAEEAGDGLRLVVPPSAFLRQVDEDGRISIAIPGYGQVREAGRPVLPRITALVALPPGTRPVVESDPVVWAGQPAGDLHVWRPSPPESAWVEVPTVEDGTYWPEEAVRVAWTGRFRGHPVAMVEVFPFRHLAGFDPGDCRSVSGSCRTERARMLRSLPRARRKIPGSATWRSSCSTRSNSRRRPTRFSTGAAETLWPIRPSIRRRTAPRSLP